MNKTESVVINICSRFELNLIHVHLKNISNNLTTRTWLSGSWEMLVKLYKIHHTIPGGAKEIRGRGGEDWQSQGIGGE